MKRTLLLLACLTLALPVHAQMQTLLDGPVTHGGYGGPSVRLTQLDGDTELLVGGRGGWIVNHRFVLGGAGYGLATTHYLDGPVDGRRQRLEGGYGGLLIEYFVRPEDVVHVSVGTIIGAGGLAVLEGSRHDRVQDALDETAFFVAEPMFGVALNVTPFAQLAFEGSYRFISGSTLSGLSDMDLSGPSGALLLRFGSF